MEDLELDEFPDISEALPDDSALNVSRLQSRRQDTPYSDLFELAKTAWLSRDQYENIYIRNSSAHSDLFGKLEVYAYEEEPAPKSTTPTTNGSAKLLQMVISTCANPKNRRKDGRVNGSTPGVKNVVKDIHGIHTYRCSHTSNFFSDSNS